MDLANNIKAGDYAIHANEKWEPASWPANAKGYGWHEAPRGALGHWIVIENGAIKKLSGCCSVNMERRTYG